MKHVHRSFFAIVVSAAVLTLGIAAPSVFAEWPEKPITIYVGWSAGGSSDVTTRATALEMEKQLGQKILVTNVNGALGSISAKQVSQAPADGYLMKGGAAVDGHLACSGTCRHLVERLLCLPFHLFPDHYLREGRRSLEKPG